MGSFVISYVPEVEVVDVVTRVAGVDLVSDVANVQSVDVVDEVTLVEDVNTVHDVRKLPFPYFPLKRYNYQYGGSIEVTSTQNMYQAVYTPGVDCEFKGIHICCAAYNIEDTYDVMIGSRYIIQGSHVKEMAEYRMLEVYEVVAAGTPIVLQYHNNSGLEKAVMYEIITLIDTEILNTSDTLEWTFNWQDESVILDKDNICTLLINQPNYVNMDSSIDTFSLDIVDITTQLNVATITCDGGSVYSNYIDTEFPLENYMARINTIAIISVVKYNKVIQITFKNISTADAQPVQASISGTVINQVNGGI